MTPISVSRIRRVLADNANSDGLWLIREDKVRVRVVSPEQLVALLNAWEALSAIDK